MPFRRHSDARESRRTPPRPAVAVVSPEVRGERVRASSSPSPLRRGSRRARAGERVAASRRRRRATRDPGGEARGRRGSVSLTRPRRRRAWRRPTGPPAYLHSGVAAASLWLVRGVNSGCERDGRSSRPSCGVVAATRRVSSQLIHSGDHDGAPPQRSCGATAADKNATNATTSPRCFRGSAFDGDHSDANPSFPAARRWQQGRVASRPPPYSGIPSAHPRRVARRCLPPPALM